MKYVAVIGFFFVSLVIQAQSINQVRDSFHSAVVDPAASRTFHELLEASEVDITTYHAYRAVSEAMLAQVLWNPIQKLSQVSKYSRQMEEAIQRDPDNIEIRFLRLAVEHNLPRFLGMSEHVEVDRQFILANLSQVQSLRLDPRFGTYILHFMKEAQLISEREIELVESRVLTANQ